MEYDYDLIIIGSGPGGYVAAIRAGQMGLKTAVIEKNKVGGMCLNWGCIPSKALLESAKRLQAVKDAADFGVEGVDKKALTLNWKKSVKRTERIVRRLTKGVEFLLKKNGVELITGTASVNADKSVSVGNRALKAKDIIISTGSRPKPLPDTLPEDIRVEVAGLLDLENLPENVAVLGSGPHAVELAQFFMLADKNVTLLGQKDVLMPSVDPFLSSHALKLFKKAKVEVVLTAKIKGFDDGQLVVLDGDEEKKIPCDKLINASTRKAVLPDIAMELAGELEMEDGYIKVNDDLRTSVNGIYAVGDVNGKSIFAHAASAQGLHAVNVIKGIKSHSPFEGEKFPVNLYTYPEMASVGLTEPQVQLVHPEYSVNEFPMTANGKALTEGFTEGLVRIISEKKYGEVLGVQIIAPNATDMIAEASVLMQLEGTVYDVAHAIHAHPTVSEIFMEASYDAFDQPIHK